MSVLLETSEGDLAVDLLVDDNRKAAENFIKLCKVKYYNYAPFYNLLKGYAVQSGDPLYPVGWGGSSIWGLIEAKSTYKGSDESIDTRLLTCDDIREKVLITAVNRDTIPSIEFGTLSMIAKILNEESNKVAITSQFSICLGQSVRTPGIFYLPIGKVIEDESLEVLRKINETLVDDNNNPLKDIRILNTYVLEDPFEDPAGLHLLLPKDIEDLDEWELQPTPQQLATVRITTENKQEFEAENEVDENGQLTEAALQRRQEKEAKANALALAALGDLPGADVRPPENILFVCKLNSATESEDLEIIFGRFGPIVSCEVIRDKETGDSLGYAFVEFERKEDCERAYFKMQGVIIDDRRIHVDFSQSVSGLSNKWRAQRQGKHQRSPSIRGKRTTADREDRDVRDRRFEEKGRRHGHRERRNNDNSSDYRKYRDRGGEQRRRD